MSEKFCAVRFTPANLRRMISEHANLLKDTGYWDNVTHFVYKCLRYDHEDGRLEFNSHKEFDESTLNHPETYMGWIRELRKLYPHIKLVFSTHSLPFHVVFDVQCQDLAQMFKDCDVVEIDLRQMYHPECNFDTMMWHIRDLADHQKVWLNLPPVWSVKSFMQFVDDHVDAYVIEGMHLEKTVGAPQRYDTSVQMLAMALNKLMGDGIRPTDIMLDIPTSAVTGTRCIAYREIERMKQQMVLTRDYRRGLSYLTNIDGSKLYFDDEVVLDQKLQLIVQNNLLGVVVDSLDDDLPHMHPNSVWMRVCNWMFFVKSGVY